MCVQYEDRDRDRDLYPKKKKYDSRKPRKIQHKTKLAQHFSLQLPVIRAPRIRFVHKVWVSFFFYHSQGVGLIVTRTVGVAGPWPMLLIRQSHMDLVLIIMSLGYRPCLLFGFLWASALL